MTIYLSGTTAAIDISIATPIFATSELRQSVPADRNHLNSLSTGRLLRQWHDCKKASKPQLHKTFFCDTNGG